VAAQAASFLGLVGWFHKKFSGEFGSKANLIVAVFWLIVNATILSLRVLWTKRYDENRNVDKSASVLRPIFRGLVVSVTASYNWRAE
jgi:hypothetical protein